MPLAITLDAPGAPDVLQPREVALAKPGPGEARIRQTTIGVNFVDVYFRSGLYPLPARPAILGLEGAGEVEAVGPDVQGLAPGDRVAYGGFPLGGYAEARNIPATRLLRVPDAIDLRVAGASILRGLTAHMLLNKVCRLEEGDWLLVHAAAGGLGQLVTRWAKRLGYRVVGTVGSPEKAELALEAGAECVFSHKDAGWEGEVRRVADGKGVQLAVDGIGGAMLARTFAAVRPFGVAASLGQPAGPIPPVAVETLSYPRAIALARPSVLAYCNDPALYRSAAGDLFAALADGLVNPIGAEYPLRDAARAHADLESGRTTGSVILRP
jgi:NADPH2:quinone reductase